MEKQTRGHNDIIKSISDLEGELRELRHLTSQQTLSIKKLRRIQSNMHRSSARRRVFLKGLRRALSQALDGSPEGLSDRIRAAILRIDANLKQIHSYYEKKEN